MLSLFNLRVKVLLQKTSLLVFCIVYLREANWSVRSRYAGGVLRSSKGKRQYQSSLFLSRSLSSLSHSVSLTPPSVTLSENTHHFPHQLLSRQLLSPIRGTRGLIRLQSHTLPHLHPPESHARTTRDGWGIFQPWLTFCIIFQPGPQSQPLIIHFLNHYNCNKKRVSYTLRRNANKEGVVRFRSVRRDVRTIKINK